MTFFEFERIFQRMTKVYGNKAFPAERMEQFFDRFARMDADLFESAVRHVVAETMTPPALSRFAELAIDFTKQQQRRNEERMNECIRSAKYCTMCGKTGSIMAHRFEKGRTYKAAFLCSCEVGTLLADFSSVPRWNPILFPDFEPEVRGTPQSLESENELMAIGFPPSMIAAGRIIYQVVSGKNQKPKGLATVTKLFGCRESDFLDLVHEIMTKKPGKWCGVFKNRQSSAVNKLEEEFYG